MTDDQTTQPSRTYDGSIGDLIKALINVLIEESQETYGDTPKDKIRNHLQFDKVVPALNSIGALSAYVSARAQERQATAMESLARTASMVQAADSAEVSGQAIIDQRESKRDYLATTFSLPTEALTLLWAMRGMLVDASIKSLSRPDRFDPYRRLTTEEIAWSLRMTSEQLWAALPRHADGIDFSLLEDFDILHYNADDVRPDDWMYGG